MKLTALAAILVLLFAGPAAAATIDFRTAAFGGADHAASFSSGGVTLTAQPNGATLYWDSVDGIGIRYDYDKDEIEGLEVLMIEFTQGPLYISSVLLTDLFNEAGYLEQGSYQINGTGAWTDFFANPSQTPGTNGELTLLLNPAILASSILFKSLGEVSLDEAHEFSVAKIETSAVPIPAAAWLLGSGLMGLVALRRRKSA